MQLDFFAPQVVPTDPIIRQRELWKACWNWEPVAGGRCQFNNPIETDINGLTHYVMSMPAIIVELGERECVIAYDYPHDRNPDMPHLRKLNGIMFRLPLTGIWPAIHELSKQRNPNPSQTT
jgi:hypothetical protein